MKKLIFSAIAMIAFVGSSIANTVEVKAKEETVKDCIAEAVDKVDQYEKINGCLTDTQYTYLLGYYFKQCQSAKPCLSQSID